METNFKSYLKCALILLGSFLLLFACSENPTSVKKEQLHLQASATEGTAGDEVSFEVTAKGRAVDADIYIDSSRINGSTYTFSEAGKHTVFAKKEGYANSEKIEIHVRSFGEFTFRSIYVTNGDVYIAGYASYPENFIGVGYWKNGNFHELASSGAAKSIYVSNNDVYVTEYVDYQAKAVYWKNGSPHELTDGRGTAAKSIYFSKGDVYVSGAEHILDSNSIDFYWKDGTRHNLSISGVAKAMDVSDGNVYLAGYEMVNSVGVAAYWKNGTRHKLSDGRANFIKVTGRDVNVAGWRCDDAHCIVKYWKNGTLVSKYQISGSPALALSFISNGDVYVVGYLDGKPFYWKNGTPHKLDKE